MNVIILFKLIYLLFQLKGLNGLKYCTRLSPLDSNSCLECDKGYDLISSQSQQIILPSNAAQSNDPLFCRAQCPYGLYLTKNGTTNSNDIVCHSLCAVSQYGDELTRTCEEQYKCPDSLEFGQQFHNGNVDNLLFYTADENVGVQQIITSSLQDNRILVWDSQTGKLIAEFKGHTSFIQKIIFISSSSSTTNISTISTITPTNQSIQNSVYLMSFSQGGELIIWNYQQAIITSQIQILNGQLQPQSEVDFQRKLIVSFGFQGEFFIVNYETNQSQKFIGHSNIVEQVLFLGQKSLISTSKDKQILLWSLDNPNQPKQIISMVVTKVFLLYLPFNSPSSNSSNNNVQQLFFFAIGGNNSDDKKLIKVCKLTDPENKEQFLINFIANVQTFSEHQNNIINLIVDQNNSRMISYSSTEILIYQSIFNVDNIQFSFYQKVDLTNIISLTSSLYISNCILEGNKFFISTNQGQLIFLQYLTNAKQNEQMITIDNSNNNNLIQVEREQGVNSNILMKYSQKDGVLYSFSNQVIAYQYISRNVIFIINNWPNPVISHTATCLRVVYSIKNSLYATVSQDGKGFVYDKLTLELLTVLEYKKNKELSRSEPIIKATNIIIIQNENVCISYEDRAIVCYDPITAVVNFEEINDVEAFTKLEQDKERNFIFAFSDNYAVVYDLNLKKQHSHYYKQNQFFIYNFQGDLELLYTSTAAGYAIKFKYPEMTIDIENDFTIENTNNQNVTGFRLDNLNNICIIYFDKGLAILVKPDLSHIKTLNYKTGLVTCGINYPYSAMCATISGGVVAWAIYEGSNFAIQAEIQLLDFPIEKGLFSFKYGQAFLQISFAAYGSAILIGDMQYITAQQSWDTSKHFVNFDVEEDRMSIITAMDSGNASEYHFTPQPSILVPWQLENQNQPIQKVIIFQEAYKYIILSVSITIYDYLNASIYKVKQLHNNIVTGVVIDKPRFTLISFNEDIKNNLFVWSYETGETAELIGHTNAVKGAQLVDSDGSLITYSLDGLIIVWNYLTRKTILTLNQHNSLPVIDLFIKTFKNGNIERKFILSRGGNNYVSIYDLTNHEIISSILINSSSAQLSTDDTYQRIFVLYQNSIHVYSYITGLKITELLGFDDQVNKNVIIDDKYIIAYANLVIQCFDRQSLDLLYSDKTTLKIYQASLLGDLIGIIADSINYSIKIWNYKTGTMLQDIINNYYPIPINGIISDKEANVFFIRNINNQIFTVNPLASGISKIENYMILPVFTQQIIIEVLIDKQSNLFIAYNNNSIMQWKFYSYLGKKGQEKSLPSTSKMNLAYHPIKVLLLTLSLLKKNQLSLFLFPDQFYNNFFQIKKIKYFILILKGMSG